MFPVVPHITNAIQDWVEEVAKISVAKDEKRPDICVIEVCLCVYVQVYVCGFNTFSPSSLVVPLETLKECRSSRPLGNSSSELVYTTLLTSMSAWFHR